MKELTQKQIKVFAYICQHIELNDNFPTFKQLAEHFDCYPNTMQGHVKNLVKFGYVEKYGKTYKRTIKGLQEWRFENI